MRTRRWLSIRRRWLRTPIPIPTRWIVKPASRFQALVGAGEYRRRLAAGDTSHVHRYVNADTPAGGIACHSGRGQPVETMSHNISKYEFATLDGSPFPPWTAGAHIDVLVAPGMMRQYSMSGDPANRDAYQVAVLREDAGRGGSLLMHRIFNEGRKVFISRPINHFDLSDTSGRSFLMGGGIGVTPMVAFAHTLHSQGQGFELHYSVSTPDDLAFAGDLDKFDWRTMSSPMCRRMADGPILTRSSMVPAGTITSMPVALTVTWTP